ncbi:Phospholipase DDHD1 [Cyphomyrmex costatus]|uniref:Phospholipase DDHD1 n=1 Tax=Cyphomyrmex costatus TaxID=456900 RepID=A0A151IQ16_9HYME|nr:Phospholipase DDHD1 [Cyphomyrmex costatus]
MYDVEIDNMKCISIYWPGEEWEIIRGTWYYDGSWIPLEAEHSEVIEKIHLKLFQKESNNQNIITCDTNPPQSCKVLHTEQFPEFHVDWHSVNDVTLYSEYTPTKLMRSVTSKLGFAKTTGYRLKRGYKVRTNMEDKPRDIDHLVFVVHGIGQKRDTGKIIRNTTCFRECVDWLKQKYFPNSKHRVEFFPVEWRSSLKLDGENDDKDDSSMDSPPNRNAEKGWSLWDLVRGGWNTREGPSSPTPDSNISIRPGQELAQRLDYVLRAVGLGRNYLYTVTAHTAYWNNYDVAYFVLTRLFPMLET